jgi:hypothetical protein
VIGDPQRGIAGPSARRRGARASAALELRVAPLAERGGALGEVLGLADVVE